jgi:hypothetical protein
MINKHLLKLLQEAGMSPIEPTFENLLAEVKKRRKVLISPSHGLLIDEAKNNFVDNTGANSPVWAIYVADEDGHWYNKGTKNFFMCGEKFQDEQEDLPGIALYYVLTGQHLTIEYGDDGKVRVGTCTEDGKPIASVKYLIEKLELKENLKP